MKVFRLSLLLLPFFLVSCVEEIEQALEDVSEKSLEASSSNNMLQEDDLVEVKNTNSGLSIILRAINSQEDGTFFWTGGSLVLEQEYQISIPEELTVSKGNIQNLDGLYLIIDSIYCYYTVDDDKTLSLSNCYNNDSSNEYSSDVLVTASERFLLQVEGDSEDTGIVYIEAELTAFLVERSGEESSTDDESSLDEVIIVEDDEETDEEEVSEEIIEVEEEKEDEEELISDDVSECILSLPAYKQVSFFEEGMIPNCKVASKERNYEETQSLSEQIEVAVDSGSDVCGIKNMNSFYKKHILSYCKYEKPKICKERKRKKLHKKRIHLH